MTKLSCVPVTVLCGFLGAGKTTLLTHVLNNRDNLRVAVIVNDMSEINIDAELIAQGQVKLDYTQEKLVELSNGCICCTLREDLIEEVKKIASERRFDYLLIESTGIGEPMPIAASFAVEYAPGESLAQIARLDTMVTVVDAARVQQQIKVAEDLRDLNLSASDDDDRTIADLLIDQIEFADVLILNKTDLVDDYTRGEVEILLRTLNPRAKIIDARFGKVPLFEILNTKRFSFSQAEQSPGWARELLGDHTPETEEYGISSFVYRARRPFHPQRFYDVIRTEWSGVVRSKGFFWLASRPELVGIWSQAGAACRTEPGGYWEYSLDRVKEESDPNHTPQQRIVCIGVDLKPEKISALLDACLLTDEELAETHKTWRNYEDPFPKWERVAEE